MHQKTNNLPFALTNISGDKYLCPLQLPMLKDINKFIYIDST